MHPGIGLDKDLTMLEKIKIWLTKPLHAAIVAFIAGLFIGLVILGWWLWPVQWYDASPSDLRPDAQQDYVCMMIDSYSVNQNGSLAVRRYADLGEDGPALVAGTTPANCPGVSQEAINSFQAMLKVPPSSSGSTAPAAVPTAGPGQTAVPATGQTTGAQPTKRPHPVDPKPPLRSCCWGCSAWSRSGWGRQLFTSLC